MNISAIILFNGESTINRAIASVAFCDEVVVVCDGENNLKKHPIENQKSRIVVRNVNGDFSAHRNWAMQQAKNEWILFLDADEEVDRDLRLEISEWKVEDKTCFFLKRRDFFWGSEMKHGEIKKTRTKGIIRFVKKGSGKWKGNVHEEFIPDLSDASVTLDGYINHYPHPNLKEFIVSVNEYSTLRARELRKNGIKPSVWSLVMNPFGKFILTYFLYGGFLDGPAGFVYAFLMSFHSFLVRAKLYQYEWEQS